MNTLITGGDQGTTIDNFDPYYDPTIKGHNIQPAHEDNTSNSHTLWK